MSRGRRLLATSVGAAVLTAVALAGAPATVGAQTPEATPTESTSDAPSLVLLGQTPWAAPGGLITLRLQSNGIPAGSMLALTVHDRLQSRTAFDESTDGGGLGSTRTIDRVPFDGLPTDATGARTAILAAPTLSGGGVYPVEVDVRGPDDQPITGFVTHQVVADVAADGSLAVGRPLSVSWVWPLRTEPAHLPDGSPDPTVVAELSSSGRLGRQAAALAANPGVPVTVAPSPETLEAWDTIGERVPDLATGTSSLRAAAAHLQVLTGPYVPLDYPSIVAAGLVGVVADEQRRGSSTLEEFFGSPIDPSVALPGLLDTASLQLLENAGVRRFVLPDTALTPVTEKFTPARPYTVQAIPGDDSTTATVAAADTGLARFLSGDEPPALRAEHLLAGLAVVAGEQPSIARGITLVNPEGWDADPELTAALFAGLRGNPLLTPTTVSQLLDRVPAATDDTAGDGAPLMRQLAPSRAVAPPISLEQYNAARSDLTSVQNLVGVGDSRAVAGERALAASLTSLWETPTGRTKARALVAGIGSSVNAYLHQIAVPEQSTITITSSTAEIPITMKNNGSATITVHVALQSDRLLFPAGAERDVELPPGKSTTVRIPVETRSSGTSPVTMTVTAAGLTVPGTPVRITVKSSFVSGVGLFLTIGAIVFLALWWGWDIHRRRKKGRVAHPARAFSAAHGQPA